MYLTQVATTCSICYMICAADGLTYWDNINNSQTKTKSILKQNSNILILGDVSVYKELAADRNILWSLELSAYPSILLLLKKSAEPGLISLLLKEEQFPWNVILNPVRIPPFNRINENTAHHDTEMEMIPAGKSGLPC